MGTSLKHPPAVLWLKLLQNIVAHTILFEKVVGLTSKPFSLAPRSRCWWWRLALAALGQNHNGIPIPLPLRHLPLPLAKPRGVQLLPSPLSPRLLPTRARTSLCATSARTGPSPTQSLPSSFSLSAASRSTSAGVLDPSAAFPFFSASEDTKAMNT